MKISDFSQLRYGMFVHFGLYSQIGRGEWTMNREKMSLAELEKVAAEFNPAAFDADALCRLAIEGGMKYLVFTTMHHEGFRMYDSELSAFNAMNYCGRDLVKEIMDASKRHDLKIGLYHSLNNWYDQPDAVDALEDKVKYEKFISNTFTRLKELVSRFKSIDILWYDGWWPFNADGWQAERMNNELRAIQPQLIFNGRNGLPGDFGTPEGHLTAPVPWRPWEACMTLNRHWGFHKHDTYWKSPLELIEMLLTCSVGKGNLLLNIGPDATGSVPSASGDIVRKVGQWIRDGGAELLAGLEPMPFAPIIREPNDRGDWDHAGPFGAYDHKLFQILFYYPGRKLTLTGLEMKVNAVSNKKYGKLDFKQENDRITVTLPESMEHDFAPIIVFDCASKPSIYRTGGMRTPSVEHPRYDPVQPDIAY